jgi:hypothetical protein
MQHIDLKATKLMRLTCDYYHGLQLAFILCVSDLAFSIAKANLQPPFLPD